MRIHLWLFRILLFVLTDFFVSRDGCLECGKCHVAVSTHVRRHKVVLSTDEVNLPLNPDDQMAHEVREQCPIPEAAMPTC